jgi:hypothetical protein
MTIIPLQFANIRSGTANVATFAPDRAPGLSSTVAIGIAVVSLLPAVFWTGVIWGASYLFGWNLGSATLATIAASIAVFLSIVCSAIIAAA